MLPMKHAGHSLIESLLVLALLSTIALFAVMGQQQQSERARVQTSLSSLASLSAMARQLAIIQGHEVEIQPIATGWAIPGHHQVASEHARWAGFRRPPIRFYPSGASDNGTWIVCAPTFLEPRGLVLSRTGRTRRTQDRNRDGRDEMANGRPIEC